MGLHKALDGVVTVRVQEHIVCDARDAARTQSKQQHLYGLQAFVLNTARGPKTTPARIRAGTNPSVCTWVRPFIGMFIRPSIRLSVHPFIHLSRPLMAKQIKTLSLQTSWQKPSHRDMDISSISKTPPQLDRLTFSVGTKSAGGPLPHNDPFTLQMLTSDLLRAWPAWQSPV